MGFISDMSDSNNLVEAKFYNKLRSASSGQISETYSTSADLTVDVLFWTGRAAERLVSDKFKSEVAAVLNMDYADYTTLYPGTKVTINSIDYSIISIENIGMQNEVIQIAVRNF